MLPGKRIQGNHITRMDSVARTFKSNLSAVSLKYNSQLTFYGLVFQ